MASTSSSSWWTGFFALKKRKMPLKPIKATSKNLLSVRPILLLLYCYVAIHIKAFFDRWIPSPINTEFISWYARHPSSPPLVVTPWPDWNDTSGKIADQIGQVNFHASIIAIP